MNPTRTPGQSVKPISRRWWHEREFLIVIVVVSCIYMIRLSYVPVLGEETRWARGAAQMLETGDWIVTRQQLQVFPERPPFTCWAIAAVGWFRGSIDAVAIRLPSVLAVLLTSILLYGFSRQYLSSLGASIAALAYPTFGQVLQIGRLGESEASFTFFVTASLLLFHWGYHKKWSPAVTWGIAYAAMALAALVKGPQAPIYFGSIIGCYLLLAQRDWKFLLKSAHGIGILIGLTIIAAWQVPYLLMTDLDAVRDTWGGLAGDRFAFQGLLEHVVSYPLETMACLLPWSPILLVLFRKQFWQWRSELKPLVSFLLIAVLVTYPSVLFATGARGRYFMPLYPCIAIAIGLIAERMIFASHTSAPRKSWRDFAICCGLFAVAGSGLIVALSLGLLDSVEKLAPAKLPIQLAIGFAVVGLMTAWVMFRTSSKTGTIKTAQLSVFLFAIFMGATYDVVLMEVQKRANHDPSQLVSELRESLPETEGLISFGSIDHRFCYFYKDLVVEKKWPLSMQEVPNSTDYFFLSYHPSDTPSKRTTGRGRTSYSTYGTLPFQWEEVTRIRVGRRNRDSGRQVILGRVKRDQAGRIAVRPADSMPESKFFR